MQKTDVDVTKHTAVASGRAHIFSFENHGNVSEVVG
jgi:hypothetical protein